MSISLMFVQNRVVRHGSDSMKTVRKFVWFNKTAPLGFDLVDCVQDSTHFGSIDSVHAAIHAAGADRFASSYSLSSAMSKRSLEIGKFVAVENSPVTMKFAVMNLNSKLADYLIENLYTSFGYDIFSVEKFDQATREQIEHDDYMVEVVAFAPSSNEGAEEWLQTAMINFSGGFLKGLESGQNIKEKEMAQCALELGQQKFNVFTLTGIDHSKIGLVAEFVSYDTVLCRIDAIEVSGANIIKSESGEITLVLSARYSGVYDPAFEQFCISAVHGYLFHCYLCGIERSSGKTLN